MTSVDHLFLTTNQALRRECEMLREENEALRKRLESATGFDFGRYAIYRNTTGRWVSHVGGICSKCLLKQGSATGDSCSFDTFEDAETAAKKALEVAG